MKTTYTIMAILTTIIFSSAASAKLGSVGSNVSSIQLESKIEIDIEAEIVNNINLMLANVQASTIKTDVAKQLDIGTVQSQTNELVQSVVEKLPEFKFKVIIAE